jgi:hypothetical protein
MYINLVLVIQGCLVYFAMWSLYSEELLAMSNTQAEADSLSTTAYSVYL